MLILNFLSGGTFLSEIGSPLSHELPDVNIYLILAYGLPRSQRSGPGDARELIFLMRLTQVSEHTRRSDLPICVRHSIATWTSLGSRPRNLGIDVEQA